MKDVINIRMALSKKILVLRKGEKWKETKGTKNRMKRKVMSGEKMYFDDQIFHLFEQTELSLLVLA